MSVSEKLESYADKMSVKFLSNYIYAVEKLEKEVGTYIQKFITTKGTYLSFKSSELRHFVIALEKTHRSLNKIVSFTELNKKFDKYKLVGALELKKELSKNTDMIHLITKVQYLLAAFHRYALLTFLFEESDKCQQDMKRKEKEKMEEESDDIFRHSIYEALVETCSC